MYFTKGESSLTVRRQNETIMIEAWGSNAFRVRVTRNADFTGNNAAALAPAKAPARINVRERGADISNGKISCVVADNGELEFFKDGKSILKEYMRDWGEMNEHSPSMKFRAREFKPVSGNDYEITARFEASDGERIFGMGQYQQPNLDLRDACWSWRSATRR